MRGGFDVLAELAGAFDDPGDEVDPVLRKVVAVGPLTFSYVYNLAGALTSEVVSLGPPRPFCSKANCA
jgi:hypothetical protein